MGTPGKPAGIPPGNSGGKPGQVYLRATPPGVG